MFGKSIPVVKFFAILFLALWCLSLEAQESDALSPLHVEGQFLVDGKGIRHNLHGFAQTFSPWFNEQGSKWNNYDVNGCLNYNKGIIDKIMNAGWKMTFVRQHMDPYWSNTPGQSTKGENDISAFNFERFKKYLDEVFVPMAEYAISKGLYVVMRPPGVCPHDIQVGDAYHQYLKKVWGYVAQHPKLKDNGCVMFELANEPVSIVGSDDKNKLITQFMQEIVDTIRFHTNNVVLVPGLGWQSSYAGFAKYPVEGENVGYAVHCYPGWYNSGHEGEVDVTYSDFKKGWSQQILPIAVKAPIVVTEMDWGPKKYSPSHKDSQGNEVFDTRCSFAFANTGTAGGGGFGANFHLIVDDTCNVSWLLFTGGELLAKYDDSLPDGNTFLTDPEACPRPCFRWYQEYATQEYSNTINQPDYGPVIEEQPLFSLSAEWFDPNIWETGSFDEASGKLITGRYGFGGWKYPVGADLSSWNYLVVELSQKQSCGASFRLFDVDNYWDKPAMYDFGNNTRLVINLKNMVNENGEKLDPSHIYIAGIWTYGGSPVYLKRIFLSNDGETPASITGVELDNKEIVAAEYYTLDGRRLLQPQRGVNIIKTRLNNGKTKVLKMCYKP